MEANPVNLRQAPFPIKSPPRAHCRNNSRLHLRPSRPLKNQSHHRLRVQRAYQMPLSCFASGRADSSAAKASSATSVYWTHLGAINLSWSRAALGLVLTVDIGLAGGAAPTRFVLLPLLPWRRRGSKRFSGASGHSVAFSWDLSRARLAPRRPEPLSGYFVLVSIDGELALAAGDLQSSLPSPAASAGLLLSRRENAYPPGCGGAYTTTVAVAGEEHEVSVAVEEAAMWVALDGKRALQVRRLPWKFRGSERLDLPHGGRAVRVTWDLHGWLFAPDAAAVFVLRFDTDEANPVDDDDMEDGDVGMHALRQNSFRSRHADSSGESDMRGSWRRGPFRSGSDSSPTVSVASTSAASSSAGSVATVTEWVTAEEAELRDGGGGFSLIIYLWKKRRPR
ncbi:hypothetical protein CFC21_107856 [Triticum aestivum]|uniref:DUF868 domain-containing protein n=4 Tax=Triticinae TaxID=1648030 RepID=A0A9R1MH01_WHEAT|nr:uncharacterized protein LOC109761296 [Aegilops tauschii subsp. strangulata]XP_044444544.1 uncharacterized protein LOC123170887 [Triticum aestivum]KAF7107191.1 hypothetical protein CFC21_107856 [Triticum aestivum]